LSSLVGAGGRQGSDLGGLDGSGSSFSAALSAAAVLGGALVAGGLFADGLQLWEARAEHTISTAFSVLSFIFFFYLFFSLFLSFYGKLVGGLVLLFFLLMCIVDMPVSFSRKCFFLVSRARGRFSLTGTRYPLYRRGAD
jgi:hypothetical protein